MAISFYTEKIFRIEVSVSKQCYTVKPIKDKDKDKFPEGTPLISSIRWEEKSVSIDDFAELIERGGCFCAIFNHEGDYISRSKKKFKHQWYLGVDCDCMPMDFDEFLPTLPIPPTIAYRTPSDGVDGNRYRLFYFLDCPLTTEKEVKEKYYGLLEELGIEALIKDNCGGQCNRYFNGAYGRKPIVNYTILQTDTIPNIVVETEKEVVKSKVMKPAQDDLPVDEKFLHDFRSMRYGQFLLVYCQYEFYRTVTPIEFNPTTGIAELPEDYAELKPVYAHGRIAKVADGYRHKVLAVTALKLLKINEGMSIEQLIYAMTRHAVENFDLTDGKVVPDTIVGVAQWAMKKRGEIYVKKDKRKFRVSGEVAMAQGKTIQKLIGEENQRRKDAVIAPYFEPTRTDRANRLLLQEKGIAVSIDFLRGYRKRNNCSIASARLTTIKALYSKGKRDKDIMQLLGITKPTLYKFKKVIFGE